MIISADKKVLQAISLPQAQPLMGKREKQGGVSDAIGEAVEALISQKGKAMSADELARKLQQGDKLTEAGAELTAIEEKKDGVTAAKDRLKEIGKQLSDKTLSDEDKRALDKEKEQLKSQIMAASPEDKLSMVQEMKRKAEKEGNKEAVLGLGEWVGDIKKEVVEASVKETQLRAKAAQEEAEKAGEEAKAKEREKEPVKDENIRQKLENELEKETAKTMGQPFFRRTKESEPMA